MDLANALDPALAALSSMPWSSFDDLRLKTLVLQHGSSPSSWNSIALDLQSGRTPHDCAGRWEMVGREEGDLEVGPVSEYEAQEEAQLVASVLQQERQQDLADIPAEAPFAQAPAAESSTEPPKRHWSGPEDTLLLSLVETHGPRNWAKIAGLLASGRTAPSCCARWCRLAGPKSGEAEVEEPVESNAVAYKAIKKGKRVKWSKWSPAEDARLVALVNEHGPKNWHFISSQMETDRSDDSCCGRWTHYLAPKEEVGEDGAVKPKSKANANAANPRWTPDEDEQLRKLKMDDPRASWAAVGEGMDPKRSAGSCRARWVQHVQERVTGIPPPSKKSKQGESPSDSQVLVAPQENASASTSAAIPFQAPPSRRVPTLRSAPLGPMLDPALMDAAHQLNESAVWSDGKGKAKNNEPLLSDTGKAPAAKPWTPDEEKRLLELVEEHGRRGWTKIAEQLGTGRTAASASARWHRLTGINKGADGNAPAAASGSGTPTTMKHHSKSWTPEDDAELRAGVQRLGKNSWALIGQGMTRPRSEYAASSRWYEHIVKSSSDASKVPQEGQVEGPVVGEETTSAPKRRWAPEEDAELRRLVAEHGPQGWAAIGRAMSSNRPGTSCRLRYINYLEKNPLPPQEDAPMPDAAGDGEEARTELENELYGSTSLNDLLGLAMIGGQLAGVRDEEEGMIQVGSGEKRGYEGDEEEGRDKRQRV